MGITPGAYNKIEIGPTEITVKKLAEIAVILEVDITYFFKEKSSASYTEAPVSKNSFATKGEVENLKNTIATMKEEIAFIKAGLQAIKR